MKSRKAFISAVFAAICLLPSCRQEYVPVGESTGEVVDGLGNNTIKQFLSDKDNYTWMVSNSSRYLFKTDRKNIIRYNHSEDDAGSLASNLINEAIVDGDGVVWLASQKGVERYNATKGCFEHPGIEDENKYVLSITGSPDGRICIATRRNILEYDAASDTFVKKVEGPFPSASGSNPRLFFDSYGKLWIRHEDRLNCYNEDFALVFSQDLGDVRRNLVFDGVHSVWMIAGRDLVLFDTHDLTLRNSRQVFRELADLTPVSVLRVSEGMVVINGVGKSICVDDVRGMVFTKETATGNMQKMLEYAETGALTLSYRNDGDLYVAPADGGFLYFPSLSPAELPHLKLIDLLSSEKVKDYAQDGNYFWAIIGQLIYCYDVHDGDFVGSLDASSYLMPPCNISLRDDGRILVCGAPRRGEPGLVIEVGKDRVPAISKVVPNPKDGMMAFYGDEDVILASTGAKVYVIRKGDEIQRIDCPFVDNASYVSLIRTLYNGSVLICYTDHSPVIINPRRNEAEEVSIEGIKQVYFSVAAEDSHGDIWLGSTDNGLFRFSLKSMAAERITAFPGLQVVSLASDSYGNVFAMDISNNVYMFDSTSSDVRRVWTDVSNYPPECSLFKLPDNSVALTGNANFHLFNEHRLLSDNNLDIDAHVILTSGKKIIASFNTGSFPSGKAGIRLKRDIEGLNLHIGPLKPDAGDMQASYSYKYEFKGLKSVPRESLDNAFIPLYGANKANNRLTFWIRNNNTGAESKPFTLTIRMNYLWYEIAIPLLVLLSLIMAIAVFRKKREADNERMKREMTEKMNLENIDFFANISHEFRTPLTLIHGAVASIEGNNPEDAKKANGVIKRNTNRLLKLISQILDFNKLDHGVLKLNVKLEPISEILEETKMNFEIGASMKDIALELDLPECPVMGWVDRDKLEKILYNLCSNALKYTPPGGTVTIGGSEDANQVLTVSVSDTGIGVPEEDLPVLFDRFYQTDASKKAGGTGIGLYITKALVTLHHGTIGVSVKKNEDGKTAGSVFTFSLPVSEKAYSESEKAGAKDMVTSLDAKEMMSEYVADNNHLKSSPNKQKILIIDDDYEVVYYLKSLFADSYNVYFRFDAMSGYKMIEDVSPDVIICDVMMVEVDGIQLCRMVKENESMNYIPFIMLTARSTMEDQIRSLGVGADAYVVKPFNPEYLQALVKSLVENRMRVKAMLSSSTSVPKSSGDTLSYQDRKFMEDLYSQMEARLKNGEMDIDSMAEAMCISRSKLFYKVKGLTGQTPNEFFTTYKLNYSLNLLKERKYKIAAIAEMLGFSSASYFSSLFKKQFGMLPSQLTTTD